MKHNHNRIALFATVAIVICLGHANVRGNAQAPAAKSQEAVEPAIKLLGKMVGGTWKTTGSFKAELKYEWRIPGKAVRGTGRAAIGTPQEFPMESLYGWDPGAKTVYYMDFHSSDTIYKGAVNATGDTLNGEFAGYVGDTGTYRFTDKLIDNDTLEASMFAKNKVGTWVKIHSMNWKRFHD